MSEDTKNVTDYSLTDPAVQECPYPFYSAMRREQPVYRMPETGFYIVSRYDDLKHVLRDTETFSNRFSAAREEAIEAHKSPISEMYRTRGWQTVPALQQTDPPVHTRFRRPIDRTFTASRVREMVPYIDGIVSDLIDGFIDQGETDFVESFAVPLPCYVIADQFGVPRDDVPKLKKWSDALMDQIGMMMSPEREQQVADEIFEFQSYFAGVFEDRIKNPQDDMLSDVVTVLPGEEPLSMNELLSTMSQLLTGGNDTTTGSLAEGLLLLIRHPEQANKLRVQPDLMRNFVEEVLRIESPVQGLMRVTTRDVELGGTTIPEGAIVVVRYASANHDEARFDCPAEFRVDRKDAGAHLAFGAGIHFCPGAMLARQEMASAFTQLLDRLDNIALAVPEESLSHFPSMFHRRLKSLPVTFEKARS
ncbi:MAG: cytochrome P450 [Alphaproteobacteria bacterium]